jgi:predicted DNA-binding WGR domain protein
VKLVSFSGQCLLCYRHWLFRSWGRIGTTIGGNKLQPMDSLQDAVRRFESLYEEKTANMWINRKHFEKVPGRFFPVDLDYSQVRLDCTVKSQCSVFIFKEIMYMLNIFFWSQLNPSVSIMLLFLYLFISIKSLNLFHVKDILCTVDWDLRLSSIWW